MNQHSLRHLVVYATLLAALVTPRAISAQAKAAPPIDGVIGKLQSFDGKSLDVQTPSGLIHVLVKQPLTTYKQSPSWVELFPGRLSLPGHLRSCRSHRKHSLGTWKCNANANSCGKPSQLRKWLRAWNLYPTAKRRPYKTNAPEQKASCQESGQVPCHGTNAHSSRA